MMMSARDAIKLWCMKQNLGDDLNDTRAFKTFDFLGFGDEKLTTLGIDGVVSDIITVTALKKLLKKMGLDLEKNGEVIGKNHLLYSNLKIRFEFQKNFYSGKKNETTFVKIPLGCSHPDSLRNSLFVVFNTQELRERCIKSKKSWNYYCKISLQGLHQPTRTVEGKMIECLHYFFKGIKLGELDVAVDVKKQSQMINHTNKIKDTMVDFLNTDIKVTTPKFVANIEESCYFNVRDKTHPIKNIKFYNKFKKQTNKYSEELNKEYKDWHRIEITLRNLGAKYNKCSEKILLCIAHFIEIIKKSDIMPRVKIEMDDQELYKGQIKAIKNLEFAKKFRVLPDADLYFADAKRNLQATNDWYINNVPCTVLNAVIPTSKRSSDG